MACQRENLGWDVGLRKRFKFVSIILFIILVAVILAMGLWKNERIIDLLWESGIYCSNAKMVIRYNKKVE
ncbi:MAG: S-4TM family putative pore-forming effector [Ruminococcus sp.]